MKNKLTIKDELTEFLLYTTPNGDIKVEIFFHNENIWLTQKRMAELFGVNVPAISKHLKNIFDSKELDENSVISILETTAGDGKKYNTKYFNLDAIISVGYRVNSSQATKDGKMRGSYEMAHDSDTQIEVKDGIAITIKNRFAKKYREF